jgi:predicted enzyme related to lactoylglutathione lyase
LRPNAQQEIIMANPNSGRFNWHELSSTNVEAAVKFYAALLGWTVEEMPMGEMGTYRIFMQGDVRVGGAMAQPPGTPASVPSHWLTYVGVESADGCATKIQELGGKILMPATTVPNMLRFAVAMDPQGAAFGILQPMGEGAASPPPEPPPQPGLFVWDELHTTDQAAAGKFYGSLFGWTGKVGEGDPMKYWHWMNGGKDIGGMLTLQQPNIPPHWLAYIGVADVDGSTKKVRDLGGKVLMEPMDVPKVGKFSVVQDPTGAAFSLFRSARL